MSARLASRSRTAGLPGGVVAQRGELGVDRLDVVGHPRPRELQALALAGRREAGAQLLVAQRALELGGEHVDVAGLEQQAEVAVAQHLLVAPARGRPRAPRRRQRAHEHPGRGDLTEGRGHDDVGARERRVLVVDHVDPRAQARPQRRDRPGAREDDGLPRRAPPAAAAARAGTAAARHAPRGRRTRSAAGRRAPPAAPPAPPDAAAGRRRGSSAPAARRSRDSSPCARRGGRRTAPRTAAPPGSTARARPGRGRSRRSAPASAAAPPSRRSAPTARARARSRAARSPSTSSIVRAMSTGGDGFAPRRLSGSSSPTPSTRTPPSGSNRSSGRSRAARISLRDSRTSSGERDGASSSTRCPRSASSRETSAANVPTSCASSRGCGATCAMANRSGTARQHNGGGGGHPAAAGAVTRRRARPS